MSTQGPPLAHANVANGRDRRSFAVRHGAALSMVVTTLLLLAIGAAFLPQRHLEAPPAPPAHRFDDRAHLVSPGYAGGKSEYLQMYLPTIRHVSVLIVTEPKAPPGGIEAYTANAANAWRTGGQGADNGMALFVFRNERTVRLEGGYGLEGTLPDIEAKHLVEDTLSAQFTAGSYQQGFDDFVWALEKKLKGYSDKAGRSNSSGLFDYVGGVLRQAPRMGRAAWALFLDSDLTGRVMLAIFAAILAGLGGYAITGVAGALVALVQVPWRLSNGKALRGLDRAKLTAEFAPSQFAKRPPPSLLAVASELDLGALAGGMLCAAGLFVGIAFAGLGTEVFIGERGQFSGAGRTALWPGR